MRQFTTYLSCHGMRRKFSRVSVEINNFRRRSLIVSVHEDTWPTVTSTSANCVPFKLFARTNGCKWNWYTAVLVRIRTNWEKLQKFDCSGGIGYWQGNCINVSLFSVLDMKYNATEGLNNAPRGTNEFVPKTKRCVRETTSLQ